MSLKDHPQHCSVLALCREMQYELALTLSTLVSCEDLLRLKLRRKPSARSGLPPSFCPKSSFRELRSMERSPSSSREPLHTLSRPSTRSLGIRSQLSLRRGFLWPESKPPLTGGGGGGGAAGMEMLGMTELNKTKKIVTIKSNHHHIYMLKIYIKKILHKIRKQHNFLS